MDYIFYATNNAVTYKIKDEIAGKEAELLFRGFIGVYTVNAEGENIYRYVNDGDIIGTAIEGKTEISGIVKSFTNVPSEKNEIRILPSETISEEEAAALANRYVIIDNGKNTRGGVYKIENAVMDGNDLVLDIGRITPIRKYADSSVPENGYVYLLAVGQNARIPLALGEDNAPEFGNIGEHTVSAGSGITIPVKAESPLEKTITYEGEALPRGASVNADTGVVTWKPDASQVGDNHFAVTARDSDGRESTVHFIVTVYGSTTSKPSDTAETPSTDNSGTSGGGGGGSSGLGSADGSDTGDQTDDGTTTPDAGSGNASGGAASSDTRFIDLGNHTWAADSINSLADDGIIKGTTYNTYSPANNITRADYAVLLVRAFNLTSDDKTNFADVNASDYFAAELAVARNTGLVNGIGDNKYAPRNTITRQDMMVIIYRALEKLGKIDVTNVERNDTQALPYADFDSVADYAKPAVSYLISNGLVNGKNGRIAPLDYTTRAEVAVLLKRILDYVK